MAKKDLVPVGPADIGDYKYPFVWSTTEQIWPFERDDNDNVLYAKMFKDQALLAVGPVDIAHGIASMTDEKVFKIWGKAKAIAGGSLIYMLPFYDSGSNYIQIRTPDASNIRLDTGGNWSAWEANIFFVYSKT